MRIKIIGENNCARATRHLLRQPGFAMTEFLSAEVITQAPHSGYAITIDLAPAPHPDPTAKPDYSTHGQPAPAIGEASPAHGDASSPTALCDSTDFSLCDGQDEPKSKAAQAEACVTGFIHFDSVDSALEAAILRHVTQLAVTPVVVDRPGGIVHSEREVRIIIPCSGNAKADEAAAVAVEFGVLRGLLDLTSPPAPAVAEDKSSQGASGGRKKWWMFGIVLLTGSLLALTGSLQASPRRVVERRGADGAFLHLEAALAPAQGQFGTGLMDLALIGGAAVSSSLYDSGNTALKVNCVVGCGAASSFTDNSAFTSGTTSESNVGGVFNDGLSALSSGNAAAARITASRALHVNLRNASGAEIGTATNPVRTDPTGTTTQPVTIQSNAAVNVAQVNGVAVTTGNGTSGTGVQRVTIASDSTGQTKITDGANTVVVDPCMGQTKLYISINQTGNTQLAAGTASKKTYICSIHVVVAAATSVALVEGTGSVCGTGTAGVSGFGGATAATGWNFAANGGIAFGSGEAALGAEGTAADNLYLFNSGAGQVSGGISYVVQ